jgi:hypothetical protein
MKLKDILPSLVKMARLKRLNPVQLNKPTPADLPLTVSCTSIPSRFHVIDKTVRSVLSQSTPPKRMILWLHERHKNSLPVSLTSMVGNKFKIQYTTLDSPHCKLVPTLLAEPGPTIVTCDDDLIYEPNWLNSLWQSHQRWPEDIICHIARRITYTGDGSPLPYKQWEAVKERGVTEPNLLPLGYGGVLYPANRMPALATNSEHYLELAPKADDLWFKAVTQSHGINSRTSLYPPSAPYPMPNSQTISLQKTNVREDGNRLQWEALKSEFGLPSQNH